MRKIISRIPILGPLARKLYYRLYQMLIPFSGSEEYWIKRYKSKRYSGAGSYSRLADFKAEIINDFVRYNNIATIIEYGSGDGNQLKLAAYPSYIGYDISPKVIELCQDIYQHDKTKRFRLMAEYKGETAQLTLSLDVIYHLIEDEIYHAYMERLFSSSGKYVIIYSSDYDGIQKYHIMPRQFTKWVESNAPQWKLTRHIPNRYPYNGNNEESSHSDFYIYEKV